MKKKLRIALVARNMPPLHGGGGMLARSIAKHLSMRGHTIHLLTDTPQPEEVSGCKVYSPYVTKHDGSPLRRLFRRFSEYLWLSRKLRKGQYQHVHAVSAQAFTLSAIYAAHRLGISTSIETSLFGNDDYRTVCNHRLGFLLGHFFRSADHVVNISPQLEKACLENGFSQEKLSLIPNPADESKFRPADISQRDSIRHSLGIDKRTILLFTAGAICHRKGYDRLIDAFLRVCHDRKRCELAIAGPVMDNDSDKKLYTDLTTSLDNAGMSDRVRWLGRIDNVSEWMQASDIFVFASRREGFGTVFTEAMATGLPVIAYEIEGVTEYIFSMKNREYIAKDDESFCESLSRHIDDPSLRQDTGQRLLEHYRKTFSTDSIITQYEELFLYLSGNCRSQQTGI